MADGVGNLTPGSHLLRHGAKKFDTAVHHPVPEALKHTTSPLSAALFLFGVGTAAKAPSIRSWWAARRTLGLWNTIGWRHSATYSRQKPTTIGWTGAPRSPASAVSPLHHGGGARTFSTATNKTYSCPRKKIRVVTEQWRSPGLTTTTLVTTWHQTQPTSSRSIGTLHHATAVPPPLATAGEVQVPAAQNGTLSSMIADGVSSENISPRLFNNLSQMYPADQVAEVAHHIVEWPLSQAMEYLLTNAHTVVGLPWWAAIMAMTFALRTSVLPLQISFMRHQLHTKLLQPQLAHNHEQMKAAKTPEEEQLWAHETLTLLQEKKVRPFVAWWTPILFPPYFLSWFACVYNSALSNPGLMSGGLLWFVDLSATDPTFLLPVIASLTWLGIVEMGASALYLTSGRLKMWTRFTALALIPVLSTLPAAVFCFWIPSNLWEIARIMVFNQDSVRKVFGIPLRSELPRVAPSAW